MRRWLQQDEREMSMTVPKMCRVVVVIDKLETFTRDAGELLGLKFVRPDLDEQFTAFSVEFGEHGLMGVEVYEDVPFAREGRLIEIAVDVENAERTKDLLQAGGYQPVVTNYLPEPAANEYLFGRDFHGVPLMVCTAGDNERQMRLQGAFLELDQAPTPKIGCATVAVNDIDRAAADFERYFGMKFVAADPGGLGTRAVVGEHRIKLVEGAPSAMAKHFELPLAAIEIMYDNVEKARNRLEKAGHTVVHERSLRSCGKAYYFGSSFHGLPLSIYPTAADQEIIGRGG
jgi:hypothetical protein